MNASEPDAAETGTSSEKALEELTRSIAESGVLQPNIVRPHAQGGFEIIDGHRRVAASRGISRESIPAIVSDCDERQAQILSVVANLQRKNLNTIELAVTYQKLLGGGVFADRRELSQAMGKDGTYVGDLLNTLNMDPRIVEDLAQHNTINDVRILRLIRKSAMVDKPGKSDRQWELYREVIEKKLTRQVLSRLLSRSRRRASTGRLTVKVSARNIVLRIGAGKLPEEKKEELAKLLKERTLDILGALGVKDDDDV